MALEHLVTGTVQPVSGLELLVRRGWCFDLTPFRQHLIRQTSLPGCSEHYAVDRLSHRYLLFVAVFHLVIGSIVILFSPRKLVLVQSRRLSAQLNGSCWLPPMVYQELC